VPPAAAPARPLSGSSWSPGSRRCAGEPAGRAGSGSGSGCRRASTPTSPLDDARPGAASAGAGSGSAPALPGSRRAPAERPHSQRAARCAQQAAGAALCAWAAARHGQRTRSGRVRRGRRARGSAHQGMRTRTGRSRRGGVRVTAAPGSAPYAAATCASSAGGSGPPPGSGLLPGAGAPASASLTVDDVRRPCRKLTTSRTACCHV